MSVVTYPIVGAFHRPPAQTIINNLAIGTNLIIRREPTNAFDPNAIAIWLANVSFPNQNEDIEQSIMNSGLDVTEFYSRDEFQIGYLPKEVAAVLATKFPDHDIHGTFSVSPTGKPQVRFDELR